MGITIIEGSPQPVVLTIEWKHRYKHPGKGKRGCAHELEDGTVCRLAATHVDHLGAPPSMNPLGSGDQDEYQRQKKAWQAAFTLALELVGLPRGLAGVLAEGRATFPNRNRRDQGNHRMMIEKALGDALVHGTPQPDPKRKSPEWWGDDVPGGWLEDDDWDRYEFGNLQRAESERGVGRLEVTIFPSGWDVAV